MYMILMTDHEREVQKRLSGAGFKQKPDPLNNGVFINAEERRAAGPSVLNASIEDVEDFIRSKETILWGINPAAEREVLKCLGRL